jgi:hypothetical protein
MLSLLMRLACVLAVLTAMPDSAHATFFNQGVITTIVGNGSASYVNTPQDATSITIYRPKELFVDSALNVYFCEYGFYSIKKLVYDTNEVITLAGNGTFNGYASVPYPGEVPATSVGFAFVHGVVMDSKGYVYFGTRAIETGTSTHNVNFMYRLNQTTNMVSRMAGGVGNNAGNNYSNIQPLKELSKVLFDYVGSGQYASKYEGLQSPNFRSQVLTLFIDTADNIYSLDSFNNRVYKINMYSEDNHTMVTVAGNPDIYSGTIKSKCENNGDGGLATKAFFENPEGMASKHVIAYLMYSRLCYVFQVLLFSPMGTCLLATPAVE